MSHELAEKLSGLSSRVNNLAVNTTGENSRKLMEEQDQLAKLSLAAIVKDLDATHPKYIEAITGLNKAIAFIDDTTADIEKVAEAIRLVAKAAEFAEKAIETAS